MAGALSHATQRRETSTVETASVETRRRRVRPNVVGSGQDTSVLHDRHGISKYFDAASSECDAQPRCRASKTRSERSSRVGLFPCCVITVHRRGDQTQRRGSGTNVPVTMEAHSAHSVTYVGRKIAAVKYVALLRPLPSRHQCPYLGLPTPAQSQHHIELAVFLSRLLCIGGARPRGRGAWVTVGCRNAPQHAAAAPLPGACRRWCPGLTV